MRERRNGFLCGEVFLFYIYIGFVGSSVFFFVEERFWDLKRFGFGIVNFFDVRLFESYLLLFIFFVLKDKYF